MSYAVISDEKLHLFFGAIATMLMLAAIVTRLHLSMTTSILLTVAVATILTTALVQMFVWRPFLIRRECAQVATEDVASPFASTIEVYTDHSIPLWDFHYQKCLRARGLAR